MATKPAQAANPSKATAAPRPVSGSFARQVLCQCRCHDAGGVTTKVGSHLDGSCECTQTPDSVWQERHLKLQADRLKQQRKLDKELKRVA